MKVRYFIKQLILGSMITRKDRKDRLDASESVSKLILTKIIFQYLTFSVFSLSIQLSKYFGRIFGLDLGLVPEQALSISDF